MGNQLSKFKVNQIDLSESLPYDPPKEVHADELEVVDAQELKSSLDNLQSEQTNKSEVKDHSESPDGQTTLF